ncbi:MAG: hypothetical protein Q8O68_00585 [Candidatus Daviesbacteria bacterium]|nr:hypothetical protein [Candidatus Daviesbacteria bacterium]
MVTKKSCWVKKTQASNRIYFESKDGKIASAEQVINTWYAVTGTKKKQKIDYASSKQSALRKVKTFIKKNEGC